MGKIYAAKTNHITNPVGFYMEQIVFSWKVKECEGKKQKNARQHRIRDITGKLS